MVEDQEFEKFEEMDDDLDISFEDLGLCRYCGAADDEGCEGSCPSFLEQ